MGVNFIAPRMTIEQYDNSKRIDVYQSRTAEWIIAFAVRLSREQDGGIPSLIVSTSVIEPMGGILTGSPLTEVRFTKGFEYVFPKATEMSKHVYSRLRGGLFHEGFIKAGLVITDLDNAIEVKDGFVYVDPRRFADAVSDGFQRFCDEIKSSESLRERFDCYWERQAEVNIKPLANTPGPAHLKPYALSTSGGFGNYSAAVPVIEPQVPPTAERKDKAK